jgi:hypothetical protein
MSYRPTIPGTPRTNRIHVRLTDAEHADLSSKADALGITVSDLVRRIAGLPTSNVSEARRDSARAKRGVPRTQPATVSQPAIEPVTEPAVEPVMASQPPAVSQPAFTPEPAPFIPPWGRR